MKKPRSILIGVSIVAAVILSLAATSGTSLTRLTEKGSEYALRLSDDNPDIMNAGRKSVTVERNENPKTIGVPWKPSTAESIARLNSVRRAGDASADGRKARGVMISSHAWVGGDFTGVYDFPIHGNYDFTRVGLQYDMYKVTTHCDNGTYVSCEWKRKGLPEGLTSANVVRVFDDESFELIREIVGNVEMDYDADAICYEPVSGNIYIFYYKFHGGDYCLGILNPIDGSKQEICNFGPDFQVMSLFHDNKGNLYGGDNEGVIWLFDLDKGKAVKKYETTMYSRYVCSGAVNPDDGLLYYLTCNGEGGGSMYSFSFETGDVNLQYYTPYGEGVLAMYFPEEVSENAPSVVTDLAVGSEDGSLKANVTFKTPVTNRASEVKTGSLDYYVLVDKNEPVKGKTEFGGKSVTVPIEVKESGTHTVSVKVANESGDSKLVTIYPYIGMDSPADVKDLAFVWKDGVSTLTFSPIEANHGGFLDPENTYYIITRWENDKSTVVAERHTETTFTENYPEPDDHLVHLYYTVQACANGITSAAAKSEVETMGTVIPPYYDDFEEGNFNIWILDNNQDGVKWGVWEADNGERWMAYYRSRKVQADDYALLPKVRLEEGSTYVFSMNAWCRNPAYTESVAVYVSETPTADGFVTEVIAPTDLKTDDMDNKLTGSFVCRKSGVYYFAIKALSQPKTDFLFVDNVRISDAMSANLPCSVTGLAVAPDANGANMATVTYVAPSMTLIGDKMDKLTKVEIKRDGVVIANRKPAPGELDIYVDEDMKSGWHTYSVTPYNEAGAGLAIEQKAFIGFDLPSAPTKVNVKRGSDTGEVIVSWNPVTEDIMGHKLPDDAVTYMIAAFVNGEARIIDAKITDTTYTHRAATTDSEQQYAQYAIIAVTNDGKSQPSGVGAIAVGKPDTLPWHESFANTQQTKLWAQYTHYGNCQWYAIDDKTWGEISSQDGDNGLICHNGPGERFSSTLLSGLIDLGDAIHPTIRFYFHTIDELDENTVQVTVFDGEKFEMIGVPVVLNKDGIPYEWEKAVVSLEDYKGKVVQIGLTVTSMYYGNTYLDNIKVYDRGENEIEIVEIIAPETVSANDTAEVKVKLENSGININENYSVTLYAYGKPVATKKGEDIFPGKSELVCFEVPTTVFSPETVELEAVVESPYDSDTDNNEMFSSFTVKFPHMSPTPEELTVLERADDVMTLGWKTPDLSTAPTQSILDDFEQYEAFSVEEAGDWKFYDFDHQGCGGFKGIIIPNMPVNNLDASFFIFNCSDDQFKGPGYEFEAYSGEQYLAVLYNYNGSETDNWAVSPELSGTAQTISLMARSHFASYPEKFDIFYSTGSSDPQDFILLESRTKLPAEWLPYSFDLPAGAKYFAIRQKSEHADMLMIDDVRYSPKGASHDYVVAGYNLYCDGVKVNDKPIDGMSYKCPVPQSGNHKYNVTALYTLHGESMPSTTFEFNPAGLDHIDVDGNENVIFYNQQGIRVYNPEKGNVYIMVRNGHAVKGLYR